MPIILILLLALLHSSFAQCTTIKTIYLQVPEDWSKTSINIYYQGYVKTVTATQQGDWSVFSTFSDSYEPYDMRFAFSKNSSNVWTNNNWIKQDDNGYNTTNQPGSSLTSDEFQCTIFGSGTVVYIYPDPANPSKTTTSTEPPGKAFYLLPPGTKEYIEGIPNLLNAKSLAQGPMEMDISAGGCGWYKKKFFNEPVPDSIIIGLGSTMRQPITGKKIALAKKFQELNSDIVYYHADKDKWLTTRAGIPEESNRCNYNFTSIIYYKGEIGNSFSAYSLGSYSAEGICKGYVKNTLDANGKMQWNGQPSGCKGMNYAWQNETDFKNAFKKTTSPYTNYELCYEMPFQKRANNLWEFDAYYMCPDGKAMDYNATATAGCTGHGGPGSMGGFYLPSSMVSDLPGTPYTGDRVSVAENTKWCYDRGWYGTGVGDLSKATTAAQIDAVMRAACTRPFAQGELETDLDPISFTWSSTGRTGVKGLMCFESAPAEFTYEKGQEFFFRGDDDIWVFINNKLVIDLGGNHMPAPGYVKLDTIQGLVEGQKYPINIFFCDRRGPGSNIRISTNIYFAPKPVNGRNPGLYKQAVSTGDEICLQESAVSCSALGGNLTPICGAALAPRLSYKLAVPGWGEVQLDATNSKCDVLSSTLTVCYGGIMLNNGVVKVNESAVAAAEGGYLAQNGFDLYATVQGYPSFNVTNSTTPILPNIKTKTTLASAQYYSLKGEALGSRKPVKAGAYIFKQNGVSKVVVVR